MTREQCFQHLDLPTNASRDEIIEAKKLLVLIWHPDKFPNNPKLKSKAHTKLAQIIEAYKALIEDQATPNENEDCGTETRQTPQSEPTPVQPAEWTPTRPSEPSPPSSGISPEEWIFAKVRVAWLWMASKSRVANEWVAAIGRVVSVWMVAIGSVARFWIPVIAWVALGTCAAIPVGVWLGVALANVEGVFVALFVFVGLLTALLTCPLWLFRGCLFRDLDGASEELDDAAEIEKPFIVEPTSPTKEAVAESFSERCVGLIAISVLVTAAGVCSLAVLIAIGYSNYISILGALVIVGVSLRFIKWAREQEW